jgi:alpha-glucosidase (family GH31 glycosyl hydrolase)
MDYYIIHGPKFEDIMKRYLEIVGRPLLPEKYFFGHIFMECCEWNASDVVEVASRFRKEDYPCDVLIIDCQSLNGVRPGPPENWDKDQASEKPEHLRDIEKTGFDWAVGFGDTEAMFSHIKKLGYKTVVSAALQGTGLYNWPSYDPTIKKNTDDFWATIVGRNIDGLDSWRQDNSEKYHIHTGTEKFANGYESHNLFGSLWAKNVVGNMQAMGLHGRPVISRGGPVGGHRYIMPWPGDLHHGLELLRVDLNWLRNGSLSAYPFITLNLGGWGSGHGLEEQNLIRRIINIIPIIPVSQLVGWGKTGENAMLPWDMTPKQQELFRYYLKLRYRLHPYIYSSAVEAHLTGRPILGALVFDYQEDEETYDKDYHFMFGRQILVAPILEETDNWNVYLPKGKWIYYWTGKKYTGGTTVTVNAPLYSKASLPMFVKAAAIIPMMPEMSYIYEKESNPITLDIYPDKDNASKYIMYDRDTVISPDKKTTFTCKDNEKIIEVTISPSDVSYELCVHYDKTPASISVDGTESKNLKSKTAYDSASTDYYYGMGSFYGSQDIKTVNIKIPKAEKEHIITIIK